MSETATKKKEPGMATLVIVLFAICAVTALLLGLTNYVTKPFIDENARLKQEKAMSDVLAADSYTEVTDQYTGGDPTVLNVYDAGEAGYVVQVKPATSFSGNLTVMVGVGADGTCTGVSITGHSETSGLGANATDATWREQFKGATGDVKVTKDNGTIDALTGATITSRAVCSGVTAALEAAASMG